MLLARHQLAGLYLREQRIEEASRLFGENVETDSSTLGPLADVTLKSIEHYVSSLIWLERFEEAEPVLLDLHARREQTAGGDTGDERLRRVVADLVTFYERWGRKGAAEAWRARLEQ